MKTKEEIKELLLNEFDSIYCHGCKGNDDDSYCDDCHRKYMNWSMSEEYAERIANKILRNENRN